MDSMAKSLKEDYLTCVICFELFNEPKSLPCLHTFCEGCLEDLLCKSPNKIELTCPTCRETVPLQSQSVSSLKTNFIFKDIIVKLGCNISAYTIVFLLHPSFKRGGGYPQMYNMLRFAMFLLCAT